ncbi:MAG: RNA-binding S4 domain-containing protein [Sulfurospirillaceae bacterium]|nr:RNA-binding S4 domain-containing protein [Sulfurospirillaceae bacterium]MCK9546427.1 RNA-binding S4 domain-containing protein [Sulfurospirillaceae bacterium]MDY0237878.1 RNA-binding S4 domain-containing protein [Campylobacterales bacterium]
MRIDKFLNCVNLVKRRAIAEDMCKSGVVSINDIVVKPARKVKVGDIVELRYLDRVKKYEILTIPTTKNTPKSEQEIYIKEI